MRKRIVAGNWKMNTSVNDGISLVDELVTGLENVDFSKVEVIVAPPYTHLYPIGNMLSDTKVKLASQNCNSRHHGAFTGEISAEMLVPLGVEYTIIGHSERRTHFSEYNRTIAKKAQKLLSHNITPIFCCGENLEQFGASYQSAVIEEQVSKGLFHLTAYEISRVVIAYEPVWAIGTGKTASADYAQNMHKFIRDLIAKEYSQGVADKIRILYGGSVNAANSEELFNCPDIDGGLIGGASLEADSFIEIIKIAAR